MADQTPARPDDDTPDYEAIKARDAVQALAYKASGKLGYVTHRLENIQKTLRYLAHRDDGWLRMVPSLDEHIVWLKWKFTRGPWERHYTMVKVEAMRVDFGLELLVDKLRRVDAGDKKPSLDRLHEQE